MDKFDKKEACEYCGKKMEAKQRNKKFCSDKCRVYWNRENKPRKNTTEVVTPEKSAPKEKNKLSQFEIYRNKKLGIK